MKTLTTDGDAMHKRVISHPEVIEVTRKCDSIEDNTYQAAKKIVSQAEKARGSNQQADDEELQKKVNQLKSALD